jgi:hypothetical protein
MERCNHQTERGSVVSPVRQSSWIIDWDWFEEGACPDAVPEVDMQDQTLTWSCSHCDDSGRVPLTKLVGS